MKYKTLTCKGCRASFAINQIKEGYCKHCRPQPKWICYNCRKKYTGKYCDRCFVECSSCKEIRDKEGIEFYLQNTQYVPVCDDGCLKRMKQAEKVLFCVLKIECLESINTEENIAARVFSNSKISDVNIFNLIYNYM